MKRWAFNLFCLVSMMIFVCSVALWVHSYFEQDTASWTYDVTPLKWRGVHVWSSQGAIMLIAAQSTSTTPIRHTVGWLFVQSAAPSSLYQDYTRFARAEFNFAGIQARSINSGTSNMHDAGRMIILPLWLFLLFAIPPILWLRKRRTNRGRGFPVEAVQGTAGER